MAKDCSNVLHVGSGEGASRTLLLLWQLSIRIKRDVFALPPTYLRYATMAIESADYHMRSALAGGRPSRHAQAHASHGPLYRGDMSGKK